MRQLVRIFVAAGFVAQAFGAPWPHGEKAAIVLTYDDGLKSQLDNAIPALDAAGLKGTFFLTGNIGRDSIERWRAAAASGHELGNHTIFHPCSRATYDALPQYTAENYSVRTMLAEIGVMNTMLTAIDGKPEHPYAMPCGETVVGGQDYIEPLRASGLVRYARGTGWPGAWPKIDLLNVPSAWFPEDATGATLIATVQEAERTGGLRVFGFHGVGGDYLIVSLEAHRALTQYLAVHRAEIWVAPFGEVMDYVRQHPQH